jgi:hypothetical protein
MPLFRRFGRPGLLGAVATTAVVAGTATMTARAVNNGMNRRAATQQEADAYEAQAAQQTQSQDPPEVPLADQLQALSELHTKGQLDDDEFSAAKSRLLAV